MKYRIDMIVHYTYDIEASSLEEAEDKGFAAFSEDESVSNDAYGDLYCISGRDENGNLVEEQCYFDGMRI